MWQFLILFARYSTYFTYLDVFCGVLPDYGVRILVRYLASDIRLDIQLDIRVYIRTLIASFKKTIKDNQKIFHSGKLGWILCRFVYLVYIKTRYALKGKAKHRKILYTA